MEKYGSGTRVLLAGRSRSDIVYQTTVGSPVRYDAAIVSGCVQFPGSSINSFSSCRVPIVGDRTSIVSTPLYSSMKYMPGGNPSASGPGPCRLMQWVNSTGRVVAYLGNATFGAGITQTYWFYFWNGATYTQIGPALTIANLSLNKIDCKVIPGVSGELSAWVNGTTQINIIGGLNAAFDEVSFVDFCSPSASISYISEYGLADEDLRSYSFGSDAITGAGFYNDGTGVATDTADTDLNSFKGLPANGNKYTGTTPARSLPGNTVIDSVMLSSVMRTAAPIGNAKALLRLSSTDYTSANVAPVPNAGYELRMPYYDNNPATGLPWAIADYNSAEKGNEAAT